MTAKATTTLRLRRVRFKDGRTLTVLRPKVDTEVRDHFARSSRNCLAHETSADMAGFAIVAWDASGEVFIDYRNGPKSPLPVGGVGQYVKDVLQAEQAVRWSRRD